MGITQFLGPNAFAVTNPFRKLHCHSKAFNERFCLLPSILIYIEAQITVLRALTPVQAQSLEFESPR
jgi:hypothetical protein